MRIKSKKRCMTAAAFLISAGLSAGVLSSCALLPREAARETVPTLAEYAGANYETAVCRRRDMALVESVACYYVPVRTEKLSFGVGGLYFKCFYAEPGDTVGEGELLAELDTGTVEADMETAEKNAEELKIRLSYLEKYRENDLARTKDQGEGLSRKELAEALDKVNESYDAMKQTYEDSLKLAELRISTLRDDMAARQIVSPMNGTVTEIKNLTETDIPAMTDTIVTVADSTLSLFRAETDRWDRFSAGDLYEITVDGEVYEGQVMTEEELGLPETDHIEGEKAYVYLALTEPAFTISDNAKGRLNLVLDERTDVLTVPAEAVSEIGGETVVYYLDPYGIRSVKNVTTGLAAEGVVEIVDGLAEGDEVITK